MLDSSLPVLSAPAFLAALLPNGHGSKVVYDELAADARIQARQPNPNLHPNENQRSFASLLQFLPGQVSCPTPYYVVSVARSYGKDNPVFPGSFLMLKLSDVGHLTIA